MSKFTVAVGADGSGPAFFFIDFSVGDPFYHHIPQAPSLDLNTTVRGVNNGNSGCGTNLNFTGGAGQTNTASATDLTGFSLRFSSSDIMDGANEKLLINGATAGGTIPLNFANCAAIANVSFGTTITYAVAATVGNGISPLVLFAAPAAAYSRLRVLSSW